MKNADITDPLFREAVTAIHEGDQLLLDDLIGTNPGLVSQRLPSPSDGYFQHPYLLWFVADNPIRNHQLPGNVVEITELLLRYTKMYAGDSFFHQVNYLAGLVETGRVPRESGKQVELLALLFDNGAVPGDGQGALANGNVEAAEYIVRRTGRLTLTTAIGLDRVAAFENLLETASQQEKQVALIAAAFFGKPDFIRLLIASGVDVNAFIEKGFHTHATALHQAVYSGSLEAVKLLVAAGADPQIQDKVYHGTAHGWAISMQEDAGEMKENYKTIGDFFKTS